MKLFKLIIKSIFSLLLFSCSNDNNEEASNSENLMTIKKTITYNYYVTTSTTEKVISYYENNKIIIDSTFNNNIFARKSTYEYGSNHRQQIVYNNTNNFIVKNIRNYDNLNRIISINSYNSSNQITFSKSYEYQNENIFVTTIADGISTLKFHYKTNSENLLFYEKNLITNETRTLAYSNNNPVELLGTPNYTNYEYYSTQKPSNIQNNNYEINNTALINLELEHVYLSCTNFLKKISGTTFVTDFEKQFNSNNYETYSKTTITRNSVSNISSEIFTYYN